MKMAVVAGMMTFSIGLGTVDAAEVLNVTLDETIQRAYENNRTIKETVADRTSAFWSLSEARRQTNPRITFDWSGNRRGGLYYGGETSNAFSTSGTLSIPVYQGGRLAA